MTLPPSAFVPPPEVHSTVFRWRFQPRFDELGVPEQPFTAFLKQCFAQKRKTISNNLRAAGKSHDAILASLAASAIPPQARAETLPVEQFASLFLSLAQYVSA